MLAGHAACRRGRGVPLLLAPLDIGLCLGFLPEGRLVCAFLVCALLPVLALLRRLLLAMSPSVSLAQRELAV